jgi:hypothetical protein
VGQRKQVPPCRKYSLDVGVNVDVVCSVDADEIGRD